VSGKNFEDFLEVTYGEHDDVIGIKYGVSKNLKEGQQGQQTLLIENRVANQQEYKYFHRNSLNIPNRSPDVTTNFGIGKATGPGATNVGGAAPEPPKEEKTFFQKYVSDILALKL